MVGYKVTEEGLGQARLSAKMRLLAVLSRAANRGAYVLSLARAQPVDLIEPAPVLPQKAPTTGPQTPALAEEPSAPLAPSTVPKAPRLRPGVIYLERAPSVRLG